MGLRRCGWAIHGHGCRPGLLAVGAERVAMAHSPIRRRVHTSLVLEPQRESKRIQERGREREREKRGSLLKVCCRFTSTLCVSLCTVFDGANIGVELPRILGCPMCTQP